MQEPATLRARFDPTLSDGSHPNFTISEMALHILAYNLTRVMKIMGSKPLLARISAETAAPTQRTATMALAPTPTPTLEPRSALLHSRAHREPGQELLEDSDRPQARRSLEHRHDLAVAARGLLLRRQTRIARRPAAGRGRDGGLGGRRGHVCRKIIKSPI